MQFQDLGEMGLKSAGGLFICVVSYKLYKLKCRSHSRCCGDQIEVDLENTGGQVEMKV